MKTLSNLRIVTIDVMHAIICIFDFMNFMNFVLFIIKFI